MKPREHDPIMHAIRECAWGFSLVNELSSKPLNAGDFAEALLTALTAQSKATAEMNAQSRPVRTHAITWLSAGILIPLIGFVISMSAQYGSLQTRVAALEERTHGVEVLSTKIDALRYDFDQFERRNEQQRQQPARQ
jgi:hypothetical protein